MTTRTGGSIESASRRPMLVQCRHHTLATGAALGGAQEWAVDGARRGWRTLADQADFGTGTTPRKPSDHRTFGPDRRRTVRSCLAKATSNRRMTPSVTMCRQTLPRIILQPNHLTTTRNWQCRLYVDHVYIEECDATLPRACPSTQVRPPEGIETRRAAGRRARHLARGRQTAALPRTSTGSQTPRFALAQERSLPLLESPQAIRSILGSSHPGATRFQLGVCHRARRPYRPWWSRSDVQFQCHNRLTPGFKETRPPITASGKPSQRRTCRNRCDWRHGRVRQNPRRFRT